MTVAAGEHDLGRQAADPTVATAADAVAALLFDPAQRPRLADFVALAEAESEFSVVHHDTAAGLAELMRDGLTFDCLGLAPAMPRVIDAVAQSIGLADEYVLSDSHCVTLQPGAQLTGAGPLLPVVRAMAGLIVALVGLPGVRGVVWLPAGLAISPIWFKEAVGIWLRGGPFPALALTALARTREGFVSRGLSYLIGQEFVFVGQNGVLQENDARGSVRLVDWLVAHGRVDSSCVIELTGFGGVLLEPDGPNRVVARKY